jgi:acyl-CoA thioesterase FadM
LDRSTWLPHNFQFILGEVQIRYLSPALLTDRPEVSVYTTKIGRKSFVFEYRITDVPSGRPIAEASSTQIWYDYAAGTSKLIPVEAISLMEAFQGAPIPRA